VSDSPPPPPLGLPPDQPEAEPPRHTLDPDRAVRDEQRRRPRPQLPQPVIDTRPYRWAIGGFGIVLVLVLAIVQFASSGVKTPGVQPGQKLLPFAAPVATSNLVGDANFAKPCQLGYFGARAVNTCLLVRKAPLVLAFFVTGASDCTHEIDTMQTVSREFPPGAVKFAAIAVGGSKSTTARLVRSHHWTLPVAYDRDGEVGQLYGVELCPMLELAYRGGVVKSLLYGDNWQTPPRLAAQVRALLASHPKA
jgi:AhpC/TSA family